MSDFTPGWQFDLGPYRSLPQLENYYPDQSRYISSDQNNIRGLELTEQDANGNPVKSLALGNFSNDSDWVTDCGAMLIEVDGFGTETYTGYNLVWQHKTHDCMDTYFALMDFRLIKVSATNPLDMTVLTIGYTGSFGTVRYSADLKKYLTLTTYIYNNKNFLGIEYIGKWRNTSTGRDRITMFGVGVSYEWFESRNYKLPRYIKDPNELDPDYPSKPGGGGGNHDRDSDPIPPSDLPTIHDMSAGFVTLYFGNEQMIRAFMRNTWTTNGWQAIKNYFQTPMDYIIGAQVLPLASQLAAAQSGTARPKFGEFVFDSSLPYTDTRYYEVDFGTVEIDEYWGSCFDYDPFTKIQIFLPFIGFKDLPADEVMGHNIYLKYRVDALSGACVAIVGISAVGPTGPDVTKVLGQYPGNCGNAIPLNSQSYDAAVAAVINLTASVAGLGLSAGLGAAGLGEGITHDPVMALSHSTANVVTSMKPSIHKGGSISQSPGMMGHRRPFIVKRIPRQSLPEHYEDIKGYPSNVYATLSQLSGFAAVDDIQLNNIPAMEDERKEIMDWLKGGVLL